MKIYILITMLVLFSNAYAAADPEKLTEIPPWELKFDENSTHCSLIGEIDGISDSQWEYWRKSEDDSVNSIRRKRDGITSLLISNSYISEAAMGCFTLYKNVSCITLGHSIEGATVNPASLQALRKFQKLKDISMSIHGASVEHLEIISEIRNINRLSIDFPSRNMISEEDFQHEKWRPVILSDLAFSEISEMQFLESLYLNTPFSSRSEDGHVGLSSKALKAILELPKMKEITIDYANLDIAARREIGKMKLPSFLRIVGLKE
jgi:hypothetical protein